MARISADDIALWTSILTAAQPAIGMGVQGVIGLIRLFRRTQGQPEEQPGDELLAAEIVQSIEKAKRPWATIGDVADAELKKGL
jgi:hypothetical protein